MSTCRAPDMHALKLHFSVEAWGNWEGGLGVVAQALVRVLVCARSLARSLPNLGSIPHAFELRLSGTINGNQLPNPPHQPAAAPSFTVVVCSSHFTPPNSLPLSSPKTDAI